MRFVKELTWEEVKQTDAKVVTVQSYGYVEHSLFGGHFEPFARKRNIPFYIDRDSDDLDNRTFHLEENPNDLEFMLLSNGSIILEDPDIWARPDY
jgi:hypothetical protein